MDELRDVIQEIAEESAAMARLGIIFTDPAELNLCRQRIHERERKFALCIASVWMAVAEQLKEDSWQN